MIHCKKCGAEIDKGVKYCSKCGYANENLNSDLKYKKIISFFIIIIIISILLGVGFKIYKMKYIEENKENTIQLVNLDVSQFPDVKAEIKASNEDMNINSSNIIVKENDSYEKDVQVEKSEDQYIITYESSDKSSKNERNLKIYYNENNDESLIDTTYTAPEEKVDIKNNSTGYSDNTVNTYDKNELDVKNLMGNFMDSSIRSINSKDIYYVKEYVDLDSSILSDFEKTIESYSKQKITEDLTKFKVENINKLDDGSYEVSTFESYRIYYGVKNEVKNLDFKSTYIVKDTNAGFKVSVIKEINKV